MYALSQKLIQKLELENINYCHWKSNFLLNEALNGYDDLDLLVEKKDVDKFEKLLKEMGFKEAINKYISFSGIKHFYGLDNSGNILHLHVYYQLKTGPSWIKSLRFDFENFILENKIRHESGMYIPPKYIELPMFIFRILMKYSKINEMVLINREHERTLKELEYLSQGVNENKLNEFLQKYFYINYEELKNYITVIRNGNNLQKYLLGKKIKLKLSRYIYMSSIEEFGKNLFQFSYRIVNKLFFKQKKNLHSGTFIVVTGLDATGKTTITNDLKKMFGKNFTVRLAHFGKPPSTFITFLPNLLIKLKKTKGNTQRFSLKSEQIQTSTIYLIRQVLLAYDRYKLVKKFWKKVNKGEIVIFDRYKSENYGVMDSKRLNPECYIGLKKKLAELENNLYKNMPLPDIVLYLTVPIEVAVKRNEERIKKGKESAEFIRIRHQQNQNLTYKAKYLYKIDTNKEYYIIINQIKKKIWELL
jgi:thymidylate kinase